MPLSKVGHKMRAFKQQIKVITLKYSKNWLHFLTATTNCSKMLNHGLFISFLSLFCEIHSILNWKISIKSRLLYKISDFRCFLMCNQSARNLLIYYLSKWFCRAAFFKCLWYLGSITLGLSRIFYDNNRFRITKVC